MGDFNIEIAIKNWEISNLRESDITPADRQEFINHFYDSIEELVEKGLSEEEAFIIIEKRFGKKTDWASEMQLVNEDNLQLRQIVTLFSGIVIYLTLYNIVLCLGRLILMFFFSNRGINIEICLDYTNRFFILVYSLNFAVIVALIFIHKPIKWILNNVSMKIKSILYLLFLLIVSLIAENYLIPSLAREIDDAIYRSFYYQQELVFKYVYSFQVGIGYIIIFLRYHKKNLVN